MSMSSSAYDKVKRAKLSFKGGLDPEKMIHKKKKKKQQKLRNPNLEDLEAEGEQHASGGQEAAENKDSVDLDSGIGHAPDGSKKSKHYEELFPVETKRFCYETKKTLTREEALDIRVKQKADRYCK